jgi:hypothetical protein
MMIIGLSSNDIHHWKGIHWSVSCVIDNSESEAISFYSSRVSTFPSGYLAKRPLL